MSPVLQVKALNGANQEGNTWCKMFATRNMDP